MTGIWTKRLASEDMELAKKLFCMMAEVFCENYQQQSESYLDQLLKRKDFWAIAAFDGEDIIGGVTAHTLPMTKEESSEIFIYDVAVREDYQRKGIGKRLITFLLENAYSQGVKVAFVPADNDDDHALKFYKALGGISSPVTFFSFTNEKE
jgi:aminoglycoside 3-N-acetyltransferase I